MEEAGDEPLFCGRAAGIDIGKQVVSVTIRVPSDTRRGGRQQETREFGTTRRQLLEMADWLRCWQVERAGMEATSVIRGRREGRLRRQVTVRFARSCSCHGRVIWGLSATQTADRGADPAATSRRCRFCPSRCGRVRDGTTWAMSNPGYPLKRSGN